MIRGVILDMDGLLIDSEPLWRRAEISVFAKVGVRLTDAMCMQTMGLRTDAVVRYWYRRFPWQGISQEEITAAINDQVRELILAEGQPLPGVREILDFFKNKSLPIALASSSAMDLIEAVVQRLSIREYFCCFTTALDEKAGKPDPAVYFSAANRLGVLPRRCLAFEDSYAGLQAAKAAGIITVVVPQGSDRNDPKFDAADLKLATLLDFTEAHFEKLAARAEAAHARQGTSQARKR